MNPFELNHNLETQKLRKTEAEFDKLINDFYAFFKPEQINKIKQEEEEVNSEDELEQFNLEGLIDYYEDEDEEIAEGLLGHY